MFKLDTKNECNQVNKSKFVCFPIFFASFEGFVPFYVIHKCQIFLKLQTITFTLFYMA